MMAIVTKGLRTVLTSARKISVEETAGLLAQNVQAALQYLATTPTSYVETAVAASPYAPLSTDMLLAVDTTAGAVTIDLPPSWLRNGIPLIIKDAGGSTPTHAITITTSGADTIDGEATMTIVTAFDGVRLMPTTKGWTVLP